PRIDRLEAPTPRPDGAPTVTLLVTFGFRLGIAIHERDVLHSQPRVILVVAVIGGPHLLGVAGIHVQDAGFSASAQRDQAAPVDDHLVVGVIEDFGGAIESDGERFRPAVEGDDTPFGHRRDERFSRAARGRSISHHTVWIRGVFDSGFFWNGAITGWIARGWTVVGVGERVARIPTASTPAGSRVTATAGRSNRAARAPSPGPLPSTRTASGRVRSARRTLRDASVRIGATARTDGSAGHHALTARAVA